MSCLSSETSRAKPSWLKTFSRSCVRSDAESIGAPSMRELRASAGKSAPRADSSVAAGREATKWGSSMGRGPSPTALWVSLPGGGATGVLPASRSTDRAAAPATSASLGVWSHPPSASVCQVLPAARPVGPGWSPALLGDRRLSCRRVRGGGRDRRTELIRCDRHLVREMRDVKNGNAICEVLQLVVVDAAARRLRDRSFTCARVLASLSVSLRRRHTCRYSARCISGLDQG